MVSNSAPASELETLVLKINDLENQLYGIYQQGMRTQDALTMFRIENANHLLRVGADIWPVGFRFGDAF